MGVFVSFAAHAQCPPGSYLVSNPTNTYCLPEPNYRPPQQAPQQPAVVWQDRYGAIATDGPNQATGSSVNMLSEGAAQNAAIADCRAKGGVNCVIKLAFSNGCAAVATGDKGHGASARQTIAEASSAAQNDCVASGDTNCRIYYKVCSLPARIQ
ncbi:DUF4189 domain-containing protein [Variovorax sp. ZT4R33]|uniref:DUF4189 domain-containing protein n=1 Tax=Variovorax sp. ZT4R33 TaxID=3443743 RepID=UPI003F480A62